MAEKKKPTELAKIIERVKAKVGTKTKEEVDQHYRDLKASQQITDTTERIKKEIVKQAPEHEQQIFSFMPTEMTRISPFFPLSKREMKNRPLEELEWVNSWGKFKITGRRLSIYDESVLLAVLVIMRKHQTETFQSTRHEICKVLGITPAKATYLMVWESLDRLTGTKINLSIWDTKTKGKKRKVNRRMVNTILSGAEMNEKTGKILITINPYFIRMYSGSFITNIDIEFRSRLSGSITKALYRFYEGQRGATYQCHIHTLSKVINLNMQQPDNELRKRIRKGLRELKKQGYLGRWSLSKSDIVTIWKKTCSIKPIT